MRVPGATPVVQVGMRAVCGTVGTARAVVDVARMSVAVGAHLTGGLLRRVLPQEPPPQPLRLVRDPEPAPAPRARVGSRRA